MSQFIDIHTHTSSQRDTAIVDISIKESPQCRDSFCSYGIHPLFISENYAKQLQQLQLLATQKQIIAVGECGFDHRSRASLTLQKNIFEAEVGISEQFHLPLLIHCVRAASELLEMHKILKPTQAWIIHGFNSNHNILDRFLEKGFYISIGKSILKKTSNSYQLLPMIPAERRFLESDDADITIEQIYQAAAERLALPMKTLTQQIEQNFKRIFYDKQQLVR